LIRRDNRERGAESAGGGTGDQQALWQNGGLFTRALVEGLKGGSRLEQ